MKRFFIMVASALLMVGGFSSCDWLLDVEQYEQEISTLEESVNFVADDAICKYFTAVYANYPNHNNFFFELTGPANEKGEQEVMILDLLLPKSKVEEGVDPLPVGKYKVGYAGDYIALSKFDAMDTSTGMMFMGGCYYGVAKNGVISDYYGFLTEGEVEISVLDGIYHITVDAKSEEYDVWVYYSGALEIIMGKNNI